MPPKRTRKKDLSSQQSARRTVNQNLTNLVEHNKGLTKAQRRHQLLEFQGLGYTALKLDNNLMRMLDDGKVQETLSNMLKYSAKADEKGSTTEVWFYIYIYTYYCY